MIRSIELFSRLKTYTFNRIRSISKSVSFNVPKIEPVKKDVSDTALTLKPLKKDVFQLSSKDGLPEVLFDSPPIYEYKLNSGIKDYRLAHLDIEYRAYNFEGYDTKFPSKYVCIDSKGDRRLKPHIYLNFVDVKPEFARQGAYKNVIKELAKKAKNEEGCEGRIILDSRDLSNYVPTQIPSPSLAHWKCGFRFADEESNNIMKRVLKGELPLTDAPEGAMYYSLI